MHLGASWQSVSQQVKSSAQFLGRRFLSLALLSALGGILAALVDYCFSVVIQIFFTSLGLSSFKVLTFRSDWFQNSSIVAAILIGLGVVRALVNFLVGCFAGLANEEASSRIRLLAISRLLPEKSSDRLPSAEIFFLYSEVSSKAAIFFLNCIKATSFLLQTAALGVAMFVMSWRDASVATCLLAVSGYLLLMIQWRIQKVAQLNPIIWSESISVLESVGRNWFFIRVKDIVSQEIERLYRSNVQVQVIGNRLRRLAEINPAAISFSAVAIVAILSLARATFSHTEATVFLAFLFVFLRFSQSFGESARLFGGVAEFRPYFSRFTLEIASRRSVYLPLTTRLAQDVTVLGRDRYRDIAVPAQQQEVVNSTVSVPALLMSSVCYRYGKSSPWILKDIDLHVAAGTQLAIVGPSGCGKSTLLSLLLGFAEPEKGNITLGGEQPQCFCKSQSEHIGYVGPEPFLITGTIRENLLFGSKRLHSDKALFDALDQAALLDFVRALPRGLDTMLRHHDLNVSMGQRQRIALARSFVALPTLLILDEASANLDDMTESIITESLLVMKGNATVIIVSHKLGIVKHADQILDMSLNSPLPTGIPN